MLSILDHHIISEKVPEIETNFEKLIVRNAAHLCKISETQECLISEHLNFVIWLDIASQRLNEIQIVFKD